jgi:hypothetical protein
MASSLKQISKAGYKPQTNPTSIRRKRYALKYINDDSFFLKLRIEAPHVSANFYS